MSETITAKRRSRWQSLAAKRYSKMYFLGGDGSDVECWLVMTKCPHAQTRCWRYHLRPTQALAQATVDEWNKGRCGHECRGEAEHTMWRLKEE